MLSQDQSRESVVEQCKQGEYFQELDRIQRQGLKQRKWDIVHQPRRDMNSTSSSQSKEVMPPQIKKDMSKDDFQLLHPIGRGGFGKVWRVVRRSNNKTYAMKIMNKARVLAKRSADSVLNERKFLVILRHPFLINIGYAFQDRINLYLVNDLLTGGDLRFHFSQKRKFSEEQTKFFICCVLISLQYLHNSDVMHRDIKPENMVLDGDGYVRLTDLGIARLLAPNNADDTSGTPGYMAPEVMCRTDHGIAVDYYALGVTAYEFMFGQRPYPGKNRREIREAIFAKQVVIKKSEMPDGWSLQAADFINKVSHIPDPQLLQRKASNRLGYYGPNEVKQHIWLRDVNWDDLYDKKVKSPYIPEAKDNFCPRMIERDQWLDNNRTLMEEHTMSLKKQEVQEKFKGYYFNKDETKYMQALPHSRPADPTTAKLKAPTQFAPIEKKQIKFIALATDKPNHARSVSLELKFTEGKGSSFYGGMTGGFSSEESIEEFDYS